MEKTDPFLKTFPFVWIVTLVVGAILFIAVDLIWAMSFVLGNVTMLMTMSMLYKSSKRILWLFAIMFFVISFMQSF